MRVLGIETSCDETGLGIYDSQAGLLGHVLYSQIQQHRQFGGVVPELASRDHIRKMCPLLDELLDKTNSTREDLDAVAYTKGPGLIGALLVGATFAKSLSMALAIPALGVHHLEAHLQAPMLEEAQPDYPFIALLVSGGHTQLLLVKGLGDYVLLGESLDDAIGEAFDKTAKLMGLAYPGGPILEMLAKEGDENRFPLTKPMINRPGLSFSFSGLKTQVLNLFQKTNQTETDKKDMAASFQKTVCETLVIKCRRAIKETGVKRLVVSGGVSANQQLRQALQRLLADLGGEIYFPRLELCTDNGAMVAYLGWLYLSQGIQDEDNQIQVMTRAPLA